MIEATSLHGLYALEARLRQDLAWLELPARHWTPILHHGDTPVIDVAIIGAGMAGCTAAAALRFSGIEACLYDAASAGLEGPWRTFARMNTLRSPKNLTGPALGLPALTFRAWFEAQFGQRAWAELGKIPREQWAEYLRWYRDILNLPVENAMCLVDLDADGDVIHLTFDGPAGRTIRHARHVVLATGRDGLGGATIPAFCVKLPRHLWAHSADDIDFPALAGKRIGVVGAGASAMDNAGTALEAGAGSVDLFVRRSTLPTVNKGKGNSGPGTFHGYASLPDEWKWRYQHYLRRTQTPPPRDSTLRVSSHANARFHFSSPVEQVHVDGDALVLTTPKGDYALDYLIVATGFGIDIKQRPELARIAPHIRFWRDRFTPPAGLEDSELSCSPDLAEDFGFQQRRPGDCPWLTRVHSFNYAATLSLGKLTGDIPGISIGAQRLADGIARALFTAQPQAQLDHLAAYAEPELLGDEWTDADA